MKYLRFWFPVVVWMAVIFVFSGRESLQVANEYILNFIFFKTLHVVEYAVLFVLNYRALRNTPSLPYHYPSYFVYSFLLTIIYALTDEVHQLFVPTREGRLRDVIIDAAGGGLAWFLIIKLLPGAPKKLRRLAKNWQLI